MDVTECVQQPRAKMSVERTESRCRCCWCVFVCSSASTQVRRGCRHELCTMYYATWIGVITWLFWCVLNEPVLLKVMNVSHKTWRTSMKHASLRTTSRLLIMYPRHIMPPPSPVFFAIFFSSTHKSLFHHIELNDWKIARFFSYVPAGDARTSDGRP